MTRAIIDPAGLDQLRGTAAHLVLLDVRWRLGGPTTRPEYDEAHLPGAIFVDLDADLADVPSPIEGRHPLPTSEQLEDRLRRWGIHDGSTVVAYDGGDGFGSARAWWVLRWVGVADVRVLDGGLRAWRAGGGRLTTEVPVVAGGTATVATGSMPTLTPQAIADLPRRGVLLDARAGARYRGEIEPIDPVAGHIPGARSAPTTENVGDDGRLLPAAALRRRFRELGIGDTTRVGVYCGSGITAAHEVLALEVAGIRAALYPGSWSAWISDPTRPVATGEGT